MDGSVVPDQVASKVETNVYPVSTSELPVSDDVGVEVKYPLTGRQEGLVDDRQDQLMERDSADGRPPAHRRRILEWKWVLMIGPLVLIVGAILAVTRGVSIAALALGAFFSIGYLLLAGWPSLSAAVLRGKEERAARKQATIEVRSIPRRGPPPP